jgi:hypothetical protein
MIYSEIPQSPPRITFSPNEPSILFARRPAFDSLLIEKPHSCCQAIEINFSCAFVFQSYAGDDPTHICGKDYLLFRRGGLV